MEKQTNKPTAGAWERLTMNQEDRLPKISFEINIPQTITFLKDNPREGLAEDGSAYYTFEVLNSANQETVIQTSAWTLLSALKRHFPLANKKLTIVKKVEKGKQFFVVTQ